MYVVIVCAVLAVGVGVWSIIAGQRKSPEVRRANARIPLFVPVELESFGEKYQASSQDISRGGMLLRSDAHVKVAQPVHLSFTLPDTLPEEGPIEIPAVVCHTRPQHFGVKFDPTHHRRFLIERWVRQAFEEENRRAAEASVQQPTST